MHTIEEIRLVIDNLSKEVNDFLKNNQLSELPEFSKLKDKDVFGSLYAHDQVLFEVVSGYKSSYYGLQAYLAKRIEQAIRSDRYGFEALMSTISAKSKEIDSRLEAIKSRLTFYKTISYMIGNVLYGAD